MNLPEIIREHDLAKEFGLSRPKLRELREGMEEGLHFKKDGRWIVWTRAGYMALQERLGVTPALQTLGEMPDASESPAVAENREKNAGEPLRDFLVTHIPINPRLVICEGVRVAVRENKHFRPGMRIQACRRVYDDFYTHEGRCPRFPGRY